MPSNFKRISLISFLCSFCMAYSETYLFSYMPEMTLWLGYREIDKAYYTSLASTLYFVASASTNYTLGTISDKYGHRYVLTILLLLNALFNIILGFSRHMMIVLIVRFFAGCFQTIWPLARAILAVFCSKSSLPKAMAISQAGWMLGLIFGPACGGYLVSFPVKYPRIFGDSVFLRKFPYVIPPTIAAVLNITTAALTYFLYPEESRREYMEMEDIDDNNREDCFPNRNSSSEAKFSRVDNQRSEHDTSGAHASIHDNKVAVSDSLSDYGSMSNIDSDTPIMPKKLTALHFRHLFDKIKTSIFVTSYKNANLMKALFAYSIFASTSMTYLEYFPVWASTIRSYGGLAYSTDDIGTVAMSVILPSVVLLLVFYPFAEKRIGSVKCYILSLVIITITTSSTAVTRIIPNERAIWFTVILNYIIFRFAESVATSANLVILTHTVPNSQSGAIHGMASMYGNTAVVFQPLIAAPIYSWSITSDFGVPVDSSVVFVFFGAHFFLATAIACTIPAHLNEHGQERNETDD